MELYVVYPRSGGPDCVDPPEGIYSSLEKAEEEAFNHAARVYGATRLLLETDDLKCYGNVDNEVLISYGIARLILDEEMPSPEAGLREGII